MHILLTNDDGIFAPGLAALYRQLTRLGDVTVVAPADSQSGTSHSVTFFEPVACAPVEIEGLFKGFSVYGSPADCVKLAHLELCKKPIDLVVAGINNGANVGINVYYSGTVAAAMEAAFLRIGSVALSLAAEREMDFDKAAEIGVGMLARLMPLQSGDILNVNIPRLSQGLPRGVCVVPQATGGFQERYIPQEDSRTRTFYQLAGGRPRPETGPTDTTALSEGYVTVTALRAEMTDHAKTTALKTQFDGIVPCDSRGTL